MAGFCIKDERRADEASQGVVILPGSCMYDSDCVLDFSGRACTLKEDAKRSFLDPAN